MRLLKTAGVFTVFFFLMLTAGCASSGDSARDRSVYLKNNIHYEGQVARDGSMIYTASYANYVGERPGHEILPVNAKVEITEGRGRRGRGLIIFDQATGREIQFEYNTRNTRMPFAEYIRLISSPSPVSLDRLSAADRQGIQEGKALTGMSKDGVRMALGYPAPHKTLSLESDTWIYWINRWKTMAVEFDKRGMVRNIRR